MAVQKSRVSRARVRNRLRRYTFRHRNMPYSRIKILMRIDFLKAYYQLVFINLLTLYIKHELRELNNFFYFKRKKIKVCNIVSNKPFVYKVYMLCYLYYLHI